MVNCRRCSKPIVPFFFCVNGSKKICQECNRKKKIVRKNERKKNLATRRKNFFSVFGPSLPELRREADKIFSLFIRQRDQGVCFTCGVRRPISEMQNGHYRPRAILWLRYDPRNCHCQCRECNETLRGNLGAYNIRLFNRYGPGIFHELDRLEKKKEIFLRSDFQNVIDTYKPLLWPKK